MDTKNEKNRKRKAGFVVMPQSNDDIMNIETEEEKAARQIVHVKRVSKKDCELWLLILSRLSIKSLFVCSAVSHSWKNTVELLQQKSKPLPLCGFIIKPCLGVYDLTNVVDLCYINITTKLITSMRPTDPQSLIVSNALNGDNQLNRLSDLTFDFSRLFATAPFQRPTSLVFSRRRLSFNLNGFCIDNKQIKSHSCFFAIHRGLVLTVHDDGSYVVHNPLTRAVTQLPKPPGFTQFDPKCTPLEKTGFIIKVTGNSLRREWSYEVVRICRVSKVIELFMSYTIAYCWRVSPLVLDEDLIQSYWCCENNAVFPSCKTLFFLTDKNRGVGLRYWPPSEVRAYGFSLPALVQDGFKNARLGECGECLHISYYNSSGVWIWKHADNGKTVTSEAWIPLLEVSHYRQLAKPLAMENFSNMLSVGIPVVPLAFHPNAAVVFLRVNSQILSYDLDKDTFNVVAIANDMDHNASIFLIPYTPCPALVEDPTKADIID